MTLGILYWGHTVFQERMSALLIFPSVTTYSECEKNLWSSISNVAFFTIINFSTIAILSFYISAFTEPVTWNLTSDVFELKKEFDWAEQQNHDYNLTWVFGLISKKLSTTATH